MDLRQLEVAVAVADAGGFSAAARRLHVVQSAVSGTVRSLERELGTSLFHRTTHQVRLTAEGEAFLPAARAALQAADDVRRAVQGASDELHGVVRIGVMQALRPPFAEALAAFHRNHPAVVLSLRQSQAGDLPHLVQIGELDLAAVALDRGIRGLATRVLWHEDMVLMTAPGHRLGSAPLSLTDVASVPMVDFPVGWAVRRIVDRAFRAAGLSRAVLFEVNDLITAADLVRQDLGVCILPMSLAARFPDLDAHPFSTHAPSWTVMLVRPRGEPPAAVAALLRHLGQSGATRPVPARARG
ncbi:MAG TPA: LysR family transcriptional regulator [Jatrophihabitans sp.]|nr:LysR family transcriptional regulator [Jatrophihabitans sp.]